MKITKAEVQDLERAAQDLRDKISKNLEVKSFTVETIPDDLMIKLTAHMKDGSVREHVFGRKSSRN